MKINCILFAVIPCLSIAQGVEKHEANRGNDTAEQISLTTYIIQSIASIKGGTVQQERLKTCVQKISAFAPGGGDSSRQQRGYNGSVPLPQIMSAALAKAAPNNRAAAACTKAMAELGMKFNPGAEVEIARDGSPIYVGQKQEISEFIGERLVCAMALSEISTSVEKTLAQNPPKTEEEAVSTAAAVIADQLHLATRAVVQASPGLQNPAYSIGDNGGSTKPYNPLTPATQETYSEHSPKLTGLTTSHLAQSNSGVSAIAVGGIYSYTTRPVNGFVGTYDGKSLTITQGGRIYFDSTTLAGRHGTVTISGTGAYSASVNEIGPEFRAKAIDEASQCALAVNDVADQLKLKFLTPRNLPSPESNFTQKIIKSANISEAFKHAKSTIEGKNVEQDLDGRGSAWRIGQYAFTMHDSGIKIVFAGQEWFDYNHISGRGYTVRATASRSASTGFTSQ